MNKLLIAGPCEFANNSDSCAVHYSVTNKIEKYLICRIIFVDYVKIADFIVVELQN